MWVLLLTVFSFASPQEETETIPQDSIIHRVVTINRVLIIGNKITKERIISRELSLTTGDTISSRKLDAVLELDQRKIYNLRLFNTVTVRWIEISPTTVDLLIEVNERWYTFPVPIFEISDRNFNEWWQTYNGDLRRTNYGLRLYKYNFRGRNETLRFTAQFGFTRRFELQYRVPNLDSKQRHGIIVDFKYSEPKNLAYFTEDHKLLFLQGRTTLRTTQSVGLTYSFRKSFYETHSFNFTYQNNVVQDTIVALNPNFYEDNGTRQEFGALSYGFNSEHRDVIAYPLKGYHITAFAQRTGLGFGTSLSQWEANVTYAKFWDLDKGFYLANFSSAYVSTPRDQPYSFFSALGYRRQFVKGYEVYVIEGPKFFLNKTTLRKKIFSRVWQLDQMPIEQFRYFPLTLYLKGHTDFGYVENYPFYENLNLNNRLSNRLLVGTGVGLDIVAAYDAVIRLEYTFTRERTNGFFFHLSKEF